MDIKDRDGLKFAAGQALQRSSYDPKKLVLIYSGAMFAFAALIIGVDYLLDQQIGSTGGLSGIGTRSLLSTLGSVLNIAQLVLLPLWQFGYVFAMLQITKGSQVSHLSLLEGFRRFGPAFRLVLLRGLVYLALAIPLCYLTGFLFFMTPWGTELMSKVLPMISESALSDPEALAELITPVFEDYALPFFCIFAVLFAIVCLPVYYRFRMSDFLVMDDPENGALYSLLMSRRIMRGRCLDLFRLDLSFWWFYLPEVLIGLLAYGTTVFSSLGIALPVNAAVSYFLFFFLSQALTLALYYWRQNEITATYAMVFCSLPQTAEPKPAPENLPWNN